MEQPNDSLRLTMLYDIYGDMLTEKQQYIFDLRYNQDYSLGEIAELESISRQAVRDTIVRTRSLLEEMDEKIGVSALLERQSAALQILLDAQQCGEPEEQKASILRAVELLKEETNGI